MVDGEPLTTEVHEREVHTKPHLISAACGFGSANPADLEGRPSAPALVSAGLVLGYPVPRALDDLVLGLGARATGHSRAGTSAVALSLVVVVFGIAATAFPANGAD
jgi:hypothetical protein